MSGFRSRALATVTFTFSGPSRALWAHAVVLGGFGLLVECCFGQVRLGTAKVIVRFGVLETRRSRTMCAAKNDPSITHKRSPTPWCGASAAAFASASRN